MSVLVESNFTDVEVLAEEVEGKKNWYIEGVFLQSEVVNRNRRKYPLSIMEAEVANYERNYVKQNRAVGELSHPSNVDINLDKITHLTESIRKDGNNFVGRAKILNTPCGKIVEGLLEGGVRLGVSSRATGSLKSIGGGINEVQKDFNLRAIDVVFHPSAPDAMVEGLMEGADFVWGTMHEDREFVESLRNNLDEGQAWKREEERFKAFCAMMDRISGKM